MTNRNDIPKTFFKKRLLYLLSFKKKNDFFFFREPRRDNMKLLIKLQPISVILTLAWMKLKPILITSLIYVVKNHRVSILLRSFHQAYTSYF